MFHIEDRRHEIVKKKDILFQMLFRSKLQKYILGINQYADSVYETLVSKGINITGFIDDYTNKKRYKGKKIFRTQEIHNKDSLIISCVVDGRPVTAFSNLLKHHFINILDYFSLVLFQPGEFKSIDYSENNVNDVLKNKEKYNWLYETLADDVSKETLNKLIDFRYNFDLEVMRFFTYRLEEQYFDDVIDFKAGEVFIDGGGYDGETTKAFLERNPDYRKVFYFEPMKEMLEKSKKKLSGYKNITYFPNILYSENKTFSFDAERGFASRISEDGKIKVNSVVLDEIINDNPTFIKLDIEGAEFEALKGAEKLIKANKPKMAVCVYHNQEDFWRIPELVINYKPGYKVYLRHYTEGILETVMYFV